MIPDQIKEIELDFEGVPVSEIPALKADIAEVLVDEIKSYLADGESPVDGYFSFKDLNPEYAEREKSGDRTANLNLEGDLWDSIAVDFDENVLKVGVFDKSQTGKADGHNNFSGRSKLPTRRFIPSSRESFKPEIMRKIDVLINSRKELTREEQFSLDTIRSGIISGSSATITVNEVVGLKLIDDLLDDFFER